MEPLSDLAQFFCFAATHLAQTLTFQHLETRGRENLQLAIERATPAQLVAWLRDIWADMALSKQCLCRSR